MARRPSAFDYSQVRTMIAPDPATGPSSPSISFADAIQQYQRETPFSEQAYLGLFDYLRGLGHEPVRPTHAGGTLESMDKIADARSTVLYDVAADTGWIFGTDDYWVQHDGTWRGSSTPHVYTPWPAGGEDGGTLIGGLGTGARSRLSDPAQASLAALRQRRRAGQPRGGTIVGGWGQRPPATRRPTLIGAAGY